jgi:hypothetical protein
MAHYQQKKFCKLIKNKFFKNKKISILELGSYNVNETLRNIFNNTSEYIGLDLKKGPGVDIVYDGKDIPINKKYDLCISCECFEHNPYYLKNFLQMISLTKQSGITVFTCASIGRGEHGTTSSNIKSSPGSIEKWHYYKNLKKSNFTKKINLSKLFYKFLFFENFVSKDLYFIGIKNKKYEKNLLDFKNKLLETNTLVLDLNLNFREHVIQKIRFVIDVIFPFIFGDFLTRKIRIILFKFWKKILIFKSKK